MIYDEQLIITMQIIYASLDSFIQQIEKRMTWIFEQCPDQYGSCIRQDILLALSIVVFSLSSYSCFKVYRQERKINFQLLPLSINAITSLVLVGIYTQMQVFNIRIAFLVVQLYIFFILAYGFIYMVTKQAIYYSDRLKYKQLYYRKIQKLFVIFSILVVLALIFVIIISVIGIVTCNQDQGIGSIILVSLQVPLLWVTLSYSKKSKTILTHQIYIYYSHAQQHQQLLSQQIESKKVKFIQLKLIRFTFLLTFLLHICEITLYYIGNEKQEPMCSSTDNRIKVTAAFVFYRLLIQNITQLLPHFIIPIIFWYLPSRILRRAISLYMSNTQQQQRNMTPDLKRQEYKVVHDMQQEQRIRKKFNQKVQKRSQSTSAL